MPVVDQTSFSQIVNPNNNAFLTGPYSSRQLKTLNATQSGYPNKQSQKRVNTEDMIKNKSTQNNLNKKKKKKKVRRRRQAEFSELAVSRLQRILDSIKRVSKDNCHNISPSGRMLPGDVAYGVETQFDTQARWALRIAYVLCGWYQKAEIGVNYGSLKPPGNLYEDILFAEVISAVMADHKVVSVGVYFEPYVYANPDGTTRELFGPFAYRNHKDEIYAIDRAGLPDKYTNEDWYVRVRERWQTNQKGLKKFRQKMRVRWDINGTSYFKVRGMSYRAPPVGLGYWTHPHFRCDGMVDKWVVTYVTPIIGYDSLKVKRQFKYVF